MENISIADLLDDDYLPHPLSVQEMVLVDGLVLTWVGLPHSQIASDNCTGDQTPASSH